MKKILFLLFVFKTFLAYTQVGDSELNFNVKAKCVEGEGCEIINNNIESIFESPDMEKFKIQIINDSTSILSKLSDSNWIINDTLNIDGVDAGDTNKLAFPFFKIVDFNKDGYKDLTCWISTNINGNQWLLIYLYDPQKRKYVKLKNKAESGNWNDNDIWDNPIYNVKDSTIDCITLTGVYGTSSESKYKLLKFEAIPLFKKEEDRNSVKTIIENYYVGKNGYWKLEKTKKIRLNIFERLKLWKEK